MKAKNFTEEQNIAVINEEKATALGVAPTF